MSYHVGLDLHFVFVPLHQASSHFSLNRHVTSRMMLCHSFDAVKDSLGCAEPLIFHFRMCVLC